MISRIARPVSYASFANAEAVHSQDVATMLLRYQRNDSTSTRIVHGLLQDQQAIYQRMC